MLLQVYTICFIVDYGRLGKQIAPSEPDSDRLPPPKTIASRITACRACSRNPLTNS